MKKNSLKKKYTEKLYNFCRTIKDDLDKQNRETNWSEEYFTPIDAEVEIRSENRKRKKITDLLSALKNDKDSKVFLVLGDPGSGKSVALRKLCAELLSEVEVTGKIPIYINLREWEISNRWTKINPPQVVHLHDFIVQNLKSKGDVFASDFIDKYFNKMVEHGRVFFLLDSFDEIPSVLDVDESSWLIDALSTTIYNFLSGAQESRGVLASRIFRKPTQNFNARTMLEIRPFSEAKIIQRFKKAVDYDSRIEKLIFRDNPEYVVLARNPFTASLILSYVRQHDYTLPLNQVELFESYISERLNLVQKLNSKSALINDEEITSGMIEIAYFMFNKAEYGLEAPKDALIKALPGVKVESILDTLSYSRLGRTGGGEEKLFSFVHRRFNEFLVAKKLILNPQLVPKQSIPTDSRWRDSLVLFCELSNDDEATKIAQYCWSVIKNIQDQNLSLSHKGYLEAIHSLRFLNDAFRARKSVLVDFRKELTEFIISQISKERLLESKLSVESVSLVEEHRTEFAIIKALEINNSWISDNAIRSCRHLPQLSNELSKKINSTGAIIMTILAGIMIFPWLDLIFIVKWTKFNIYKIPKILLYFFFGTIITIPIIYLLVSLFSDIVFYFLTIFYAVIFLVIVFRGIYFKSVDKRLLRKIVIQDGISRKVIHKLFNEFKTSYGRLEFVQIIRDTKINRVTGNWNEYIMPNFNDEASTLLAQLEEKWLGFEK